MYTPTNEQIELKNAIQAGKNVLVKAAAGAAKTTSIKYIAKETPNKTVLVICFNATNAEEGRTAIDRPANIHYSTIHSIAHARTGLKHKLNQWLDYKDITEKDLMAIGAFGFKQQVAVRRAMFEAVRGFCTSSQVDIVDYVRVKWQYLLELEPTLRDVDKHGFVSATLNYWKELIDPKSKTKITHDVYLKVFQLSEEPISGIYDKSIGQAIPIDILVLDEMQDSNPVTISIFENQTHLQRVAVGDSYQSIYEWRGAIGAIDSFLGKGYELKTLSTSFRFNNKIAALANKVIDDHDFKVIGAGKKEVIETKAHLCRTNLRVLEVVLAYMEEGKQVSIKLDLQDLFSKLWHLSSASNGATIKYPNKDLKDITDRESLDKALAHNDDLRGLVRVGAKLITLYGGYTQAKAALEATAWTSGITISTLHKSKGLEWDEVTIDQDFLKGEYDKETEETVISEDYVVDEMELFPNICLLYVGITRARVKINLPFYINEWLGI